MDHRQHRLVDTEEVDIQGDAAAAADHPLEVVVVVGIRDMATTEASSRSEVEEGDIPGIHREEEDIPDDVAAAVVAAHHHLSKAM